MEVFNSIVSGNALSTKVHTKVIHQQQLQKGRRRLSHLRSNVKDSPTSHASGQLLQDLNRVKKWAIEKVPVLNKMRNKSTGDEMMMMMVIDNDVVEAFNGINWLN